VYRRENWPTLKRCIQDVRAGEWARKVKAALLSSAECKSRLSWPCGVVDDASVVQTKRQIHRGRLVRQDRERYPARQGTVSRDIRRVRRDRAIRHNPRHLYAERRAADHSANIRSRVFPANSVPPWRSSWRVNAAAGVSAAFGGWTVGVIGTGVAAFRIGDLSHCIPRPKWLGRCNWSDRAFCLGVRPSCLDSRLSRGVPRGVSDAITGSDASQTIG
jgi:hypothetical protein